MYQGAGVGGEGNAPYRRPNQLYGDYSRDTWLPTQQYNKSSNSRKLFCAARPLQSLGSQCFELLIKWVDIPCKLVKSSASKWVKSDIIMVLRIGAGECESVTKPRLHLELAVPWLLSTFGFLFLNVNSGDHDNDMIVMSRTKWKVPSTLFSHPVHFELFVL